VARHAQRSGLVAQISNSTVWRCLHEDAIRPWQHRCWIFPRDPQFQAKAGRILDLYERLWQGERLREDELVLSTDEKTSIQARLRIHPSLPTRPGEPMRVEHEYARGGAWAYLAALDVHRTKVFGRCEAATGIAPFERLVDQVMSQPPYNSARRVFWIMDNGSSHRGEASVRRLTSAYCTGLMLPLSRKSVEPMAARVDPLHASARHQSLHHFVAKAEWSDDEMLRRVSQWVVPKMDLSAGGFWIIDDTGLPKKGKHSVGVARQYCRVLGKQDNCQVAVSISLTTAQASVPVAYRLYLPKEWA
jgi:hypothetical protein